MISKKTKGMKENKAVTVGITAGDINGIGPEVILKTLAEGLVYERNITPIVYHYPKVFHFQKKYLKIDDFRYHNIQNPKDARVKMANYIDVDIENHKVEFGKNTALGASLGFRSFEVAARDAKNHLLNVLVTAPMGKNHENQENFVGHTEYLGDVFQIKDPLMFFVSEELRIATVTTHVPLQAVCENITADRLKHKIRLLHQSLQEDFGIAHPKIAVLGMHPHAGEDGLLGTEDRDIVAPVVRELAEKEHLWVWGPFAADGFFGYGNFKNFDAVLAMYHDQALIPFKLLCEGQGINFTAGLPIVRTSPIHGTAYNIAGKNIAQHASMRQAILWGAKIFEQRTQNRALAAQKLGHFKVEKERNS